MRSKFLIDTDERKLDGANKCSKYLTEKFYIFKLDSIWSTCLEMKFMQGCRKCLLPTFHPNFTICFRFTQNIYYCRNQKFWNTQDTLSH